jgi:hypothetical protein
MVNRLRASIGGTASKLLLSVVTLRGAIQAAKTVPGPPFGVYGRTFASITCSRIKGDEGLKPLDGE